MKKKVVQSADIDLNPEFRRALDLMENTNRHVFVTGRAGTGKSTLLTYFRGNTKKKVVVLAPTGVAAINVGGADDPFLFRIQARRDAVGHPLKD